MRGSVEKLGLLVVSLALAACNDGGLVGATTTTPTPSPTFTPTPEPTSTPIPCHFYGIDAGSNLWDIDPVAVTATMIGPTGISAMTDIAITADNRIIGMTFTGAYEIDPITADATPLTNAAWLFEQNALDAMLDGRLLVGGGTQLFSVDPATGQKVAEGTMGGGKVFSGDIATVDATTALATGKPTSGTGNDHLFRFDLSSNGSTDEGDLGYPKVFGLDYGCDGLLYGMVAQNPPKLLRVNPNTAQTTLLGPMAGGPSTLWGAAGPAQN